MSKGMYLLLMDLPENRRIEVGRLGTFSFPKGAYLYVGSALRNLEKRVARHVSRTKRLRWHIDFLLEFAEIRGVMTIPTEERLECALNTMVSERIPAVSEVRGFGSSDCRCVTHLWRCIVPPGQHCGEGNDGTEVGWEWIQRKLEEALFTSGWSSCRVRFEKERQTVSQRR